MKTPIEPRSGNLARIADHIRSAISPIDPRIWTILWAVTLSVTSILYLLPNAGPPGQMQLDKVAHLIAFGAIGFSGYLGPARRRPSVPMLVSLILALLLEWLQGYVPGREYSLLDCAANLAGIAAGFAAGAAVCPRRANELDPSA
jgi:VanZ family protein